MSCGAALSAPEPVARPEPSAEPGAPEAPPEKPTLVHRKPIERNWYHRFVEGRGRMWDIFPWTGLAFFALLGILGFGAAPDAIKVVIGALWVLWYIAFFAWLVIDVRYVEEEWWWIPIAWVCLGYPIVFVVYWFRTR